MKNSTIEWTDDTFNPWQGCVKVSPACDHCYAERLASRKIHTDLPLWGKDAHRRIASDAYWEQPISWNRQAQKKGVRRRVFCGSMCDVMEDRPDLHEQRQRLYRLIEDTPNLDWLLLTKRPQNYSRFLPEEWLKIPRRNVWLMTTCESQEYVWRVDAIVKVVAVVHGVSMEPLLGPVVLPDSFLRSTNSWVITGGESGSGSRPTQIQWFRQLRDACIAASRPFHFKQWGWNDSSLVKIGTKHWDGYRTLDGRTWDEFPVVR
jgi:protein gp37